MKRQNLLVCGLAAAAFGLTGSAYALDYTAQRAGISSDDPKIENPDSTGFKFTDVKVNPTGSVKDQNKSGTCWAFSGISTLEDNVRRKTGRVLDISEMYVVRKAYEEKAEKYMRMGGKINFSQGGSFGDVQNMVSKYGAMPEEAYAGLNYGEKKHSHYELADALEAYLNSILKRGQRGGQLSTAWKAGFNGILDAYLGAVPETFVYEGKAFTPQEWAKAMGLEPEKFTNFISYSHHPFYSWAMLEVPDNWEKKTIGAANC